MKKLLSLYLVTIGAMWIPFVQSQQPADIENMQSMTTMEIMLKIITPATNTLWSVSDNPDSAEWETMVKAAMINLEASKVLTEIAASEQDRVWAAEEQWQIYTQELITASQETLAAAQAKNIDAFYEGTNAVYLPCESCHKSFNKGVMNN